MKKTVEAIIQARMGSTRLPGKVMADLCGNPVLWHILQRVKQAKLIDQIVVATSTSKQDDLIYDYLLSQHVACYRGSENDVLSRYYEAAKQYPADAIVRITGDCPLIDPKLIDMVIEGFLAGGCEYASNTGEPRSYPRGLDCEIFTFGLLEKAYHEATEDYEREHVTPYMYWKQKSVLSVRNEEELSDMRWTLDTQEDFQLIREVYQHFYHGRHDFYMRDIVSFLKEHPEIVQFNQYIKQKSVKSNRGESLKGKEILALYGGEPVRPVRLNYGRQFIDQADIDAVTEVLNSDYLTCGPKIAELEQQLCQLTGAGFAVAVSSGTAALHVACLAAGIGEGDEVIVSPVTFAASANCILYCGGTPVFADIDESTWNISPASVEKNITSRTKAVIAVDFMGQAAPLHELEALCRQNGLLLMEDAAHSIGTRYKGRMVGSIADMTTFSFHPVKTITAGEGGAVMTNDLDFYDRAARFRVHGITRDESKLLHRENGNWYYEQQALGYNYRMTELQAALCCSQLQKLSRFARRRKELVVFYNREFSDRTEIILPKEIPQSDTVRHLYVIRLNMELLRADRKTIYEALQAEHIGVNVHYIPVYRLPYYEQLGYRKGLCPNAEAFYEECLTLPLYYSMTDDDAWDVVRAVKKVLNYFRMR